MIKVGDMAPDFTLVDQNGEEVSLSDYKGRKVLLSWHPLAFTSVCTDQMRALDRELVRFKEKNVVPLGISVDPQPSKSAWAKNIALDELKILSDFTPLGKVTKDYDLFIEDFGASQRANVLVGEDGKVVWAKQYELTELPNLDEVIANLDK